MLKQEQKLRDPKTTLKYKNQGERSTKKKQWRENMTSIRKFHKIEENEFLQ